MRRLLLAWALALPLVAVGAQLAHWLGYAVAAPGTGARGELLAATGHGYLASLPLLVAASVGLLAAAFLLVAFDGAAGRARLRVQRWPFAVVPFLGFLAQELAERGASGGAVTVTTLLETPVALGLLLQLPVAALTYGVAVLLTRAAVRLGCLLGEPTPRSAETPFAFGWRGRDSSAPGVAIRAVAPARGPPAPLPSAHS